MNIEKTMEDNKEAITFGALSAMIHGLWLEVSVFSGLGQSITSVLLHTIEVGYYGLIGGIAGMIAKTLFTSFTSSRFYKKTILWISKPFKKK